MTRTEDDLLAAILAEPADDLPRHALADLWEERGDPRGEFMRVQLRLAELGDDGGAIAHDIDGRCVCELCALRKQELRLFWDNNVELTGVVQWPSDGSRLPWRLPQHARDGFPRDRIVYEYRRGLIAQVECPAGHWIESGKAIVSRLPVEEVVLTTPPATFSEQNVRDRTIHFWLAGVPTMRDYIVPEMSLTMLRSELLLDARERIACECLKNWLPGSGKNGIRYSLSREARSAYDLLGLPRPGR